MNWKLILNCSPLAVLMGIASLFGFTRGIEWVLWLIIAIVVAFLVARRTPSHLLPTGLMIGLTMGIINAIIQTAFFSAYLESNPDAAEQFAQAPGGLDGRIIVMVSGPFIGLLYGLVLGLFCFIAGRIVQREQSHAA